MNKKTYIIKLFDIIGGKSAFGNEEGRKVYNALRKVISEHPNTNIFGISLSAIERTDASFPRESVVTLIKSFRGEKGFFLLDFISQDLRDNWDYAALAKEQTIIVFEDEGYSLIGSKQGEAVKKLLDFIIDIGTVTTSKVAEQFGISAQNASAKLKKLYEQGLIIGSKEPAETGGMEYVYKAIKKI